MRKEKRAGVKKTVAIFEIALMISLTIAFSVIMSESVSGETMVERLGTAMESGGAQSASSSASNSVTPTPNVHASVVGSGTPGVGRAVAATPPAGAYRIEVNELGGPNSRIYKDDLGNVLGQAPEGAPVGNINGITETAYEPYDAPLFGKIASPIAGNLVQGLVWSFMVIGAIQLIGGLVGLDKGLTNSLTYSAVGGIMAGKLSLGLMQSNSYGGATLNSLGGKIGLSQGQAAFGIGAIVAIAIFIATYKKTDTKRVQFQCLPWEAPTGGQNCEECNRDPFRPCTEYRCRSLGQACELLNANTANAQCAWVSRNDVESPKIIPSNAALYPENLKYEPDTQIRPPSIGSKILTNSNSCLPAFTPLEFGFTTNEPAQCKVDIVHTSNFESMGSFVGDDNYFSYNHTQKMRLPGPRDDASTAIQIRNDGTMGLYVRCKDANGNENVDEYVFSFCVDKGLDTTPPVMEEFSLPDGSYVTYNADNVPIELYVNEPAQCKWSSQDKNYDDMENMMTCFNSPDQVNADLQYTCETNVTGVRNMQENNYYFRCKDEAENKNTASKKLLLRGSQPLNILKVLPNETVTGSTEYVKVNLEVETGDGAEEGKAICYFSESGTRDSYIQMFETDSFMHSQELSLRDGEYKYYFRCIDYGGNTAENSTEFRVFSDRNAPMVTRAYREENFVKIVTDEDAQCTYSLSTCDFNLEDGMEMQSYPDALDRIFAEWKAGQVYYIKCQDLYQNQPSPNQCSIVVSTVEISHNTDEDDD